RRVGLQALHGGRVERLEGGVHRREDRELAAVEGGGEIDLRVQPAGQGGGERGEHRAVGGGGRHRLGGHGLERAGTAGHLLGVGRAARADRCGRGGILRGDGGGDGAGGDRGGGVGAVRGRRVVVATGGSGERDRRQCRDQCRAGSASPHGPFSCERVFWDWFRSMHRYCI